VEIGPQERIDLIRRYYRAYEDDDRGVLEQLLHPEFTFTSPDDDRIDRSAYFERCWPPHENIRHFALLDICADAHGVLVRYRAREFVGPGFANVERFELEDNRVSHIEVYFGRRLE
jgi:ketosteroid isomerase-like protein